MKLKRFLENPYRVFSVLANKGLFHWLADETYLKLQFRAQLGKWPNLQAPKTFNEKLQWLKLHDRKPVYTQMVDKYEAKRYVAERIGQENIIPTLGVWDRFEDIDFETLPEQFVLKCTHDSGGLVICRDKTKLDRQAAKAKIEKCLQRNYFWSGREWPYKNVKPRIIAETLMGDESQTDSLKDYKFYCFNGEPRILYISEGLEHHSTASISFLNLDWTFAPFYRSDYKPFSQLPVKPTQFEQMLVLARTLAQHMPFLRVDLYEIGGKVYFSELTFSPCSGFMPFDPPQWDAELGKWLTLPLEENTQSVSGD